MPYLGRDLDKGNYLKLDDISSSFNGSTTTFDLKAGGSDFYPGSAYAILVSLGGILQEPEGAYTINKNQITFASAPVSGTTFFCTVIGTSVGIGVPGHGTVNGSQLASPFNYDGGLFYLDSTNDKVGIASESPTVELDVKGRIKGDYLTAVAATFTGNVSIAGTLTYQDVSYVDSVGIITAQSGIYLDKFIYHLGDLNTSFGFPNDATDTFVVNTSSSEKLRVTSAGKVGIGTDNPLTGLHLEDDTSDGGFTFRRKNGTVMTQIFGDGSGTNARQLMYSGGAAKIHLNTAGVSYFNGGHLGVGDNNPDTRLSVTAASGTDVVGKFTSTDAKAWIQFRDNTTADTGVMIGAEANDMMLRAGSNERLRITSTGQVSISGAGTTFGNNTLLNIAPANRTTAFDASDGNTWHDVVLKQTGSATNNAVGIAFETSTSGYHKNAGTGIAAVKNGTNSDYGSHLVFITRGQSTAASEKVRITDTGYMGIGSVNPTYALMIQGAGNANAGMYLYNNTGAEGIKIVPESNGNCRIYSSTADALCLGTNDTDRITIAADGSSVNFTGNIGINQSTPTRNLHIEGTAHQSGIIIHTAGNHSTAIDMDSNRSSAAGGLAEINFKWNGTGVGQIGAYAGSDTSNKDDGHIHFGTASAGSIVERLRITSGGVKQIKNGNLNILSTYIDFSGDISTPSTAAAIFRPADNTLAFSTANTERLRITSGGNILPGTNNATSIGDGSTNFNSIWASTRFRGNDNVKLVLGNAQDLVIRHDGSNNIIGSPVGGDLHIKSGTGDNDNQLIAAFKHSNGSVGIATAIPYSILTAYGENKSDSGSATGQITAKDNAAYNASPTGGIVFQGHYHSNRANAVFGGITGFKENATDGNYAGALGFHVRANGAVAYEAVRITSAGQVVVGGTSLGASGSFGMEPNGHVRSVLAASTAGDTLLGAIYGVSNGFQINTDGSNNQTYTFFNGNVASLRITSAGLLLLGTTDTGFSTGYTNMTIGNTSTQNTGLTIASSASNGYGRIHFADANSGNAIYAGWIAYDHANDSLIASTNSSGSTKVRIDSSGRLGLGGLAPSDYYSTYSQFVLGKTNDSAGMTIVSGTSHAGYLTFADGTSSADQYRGRIFYLHSDNSFNFRANGMNHDILKIDSSQVYITSNNTDGVLNLDTTGSNGTFIRFKQNGTTRNWIGCSAGLGGYGDNDDMTLLSTDNIILATNSAPRLQLDGNGQLQVGVNGGTVWNQTDSGTRFHTHLCTGSFYSGTGAIVIRTNIPSHDVSGHTMFSFRITGYWYNNTVGGVIDCVVGCYSGENAYYNPSITGTYPNNWQDNVKFAKCTSGTYNNKLVCVLGTTSGANDCEIAVTDFVQGFSGTNITYARNWSMTKTTDISTYNGSANRAIHRANEFFNEEFRAIGDGYGELLKARKGKRSTIQGEYQYTQINQGNQYKHYIKTPNGDNDLTDDFAGQNWSALISVGVVGTSTVNTACHYYFYDNSDDNNSIVMQHRFGHGASGGSGSNQCYMQLYNSKPAWLMDHATGYRVTVRVKFLTGGEDGSTYTTAEGDYGSN